MEPLYTLWPQRINSDLNISTATTGMDVDGLQKTLEALGVPRLKLKTTMRSVAHWVNRVNEAQGAYTTVVPQEVASLKKIAELGVISLSAGAAPGAEMVTSSLTPTGKELSKD